MSGETAPIWNFAYFLPNIDVKWAVDHDYIALVPHDDTRLKDIQPASSIATMFSHFSDAFGRPKKPSALIYKSDVAQKIGLEGIVAFRNAVAISSVSRGWALVLSTGNSALPIWTDTFAIYPIHPGNERFLVTDSPAMAGLDDAEEFDGQMTASLPQLSGSCRDERLFFAIMRQWDKRFVGGRRKEWKTTVLFRSLEMGYNAGTVPIDNKTTIQDVGTKLALWVSAFETLSHPYGKKRASLETVLNLLDVAQWKCAKLQKRLYRTKRNGRSRALMLVQRLYVDLYRARCDFLHGNSVSSERLHAFGDKTSLRFSLWHR